jgi:hypothetical protein
MARVSSLEDTLEDTLGGYLEGHIGGHPQRTPPEDTLVEDTPGGHVEVSSKVSS